MTSPDATRGAAHTQVDTPRTAAEMALYDLIVAGHGLFKSHDLTALCAWLIEHGVTLTRQRLEQPAQTKEEDALELLAAYLEKRTAHLEQQPTRDASLERADDSLEAYSEAFGLELASRRRVTAAREALFQFDPAVLRAQRTANAELRTRSEALHVLLDTLTADANKTWNNRTSDLESGWSSGMRQVITEVRALFPEVHT